MMAMVSYRSRDSFEERFGRDRQPDADAPASPFQVESYLRYQGDKLDERFDANCYVHLTRQMDSHDIARGRGDYDDVLASIEQPALVLGVSSDVLYPLEEQQELAGTLPNATLDVIDSPHGHDGFLIEQDAIGEVLAPWLQTHAAPAAAPDTNAVDGPPASDGCRSAEPPTVTPTSDNASATDAS
jgi:homoserine O-acetyltransferase